LIAILEQPGMDGLKATLVDSALNHVDEWRRVINVVHTWNAGDAEVEYFAAPRGRCLMNSTTGAGLIYHGNRTRRPMLVQIARQFGFRKFEAREDDHYLMGLAADQLFDDEQGSRD